MFDAKQCARVAASDFIAEHGWTAYHGKTSQLGIRNLRDMSDDDALRLCKALGRGQMFASAKASGEVPKPKKTTAQGINDLAEEIYGGKLNPDEAAEDDDAADEEISPRHAVQSGELPGSLAEIDAAEIFARYNKKKADPCGVKPGDA